MVATSLDSKESVICKYSTAASSNLKELEDLGCVLLHEVDVNTMRQHPLLVNQRFDRVVFNFPHAGFIFREHEKSQIKLHQDLVRAFFASACEMLNESGEVHVTHKTAYPFRTEALYLVKGAYNMQQQYDVDLRSHFDHVEEI
ncbi:hypothetical protein ACLB2K_023366 [Fragaria x ananassa]